MQTLELPEFALHRVELAAGLLVAVLEAGEFFFEPKSGFRMDWYMNKFWVNYDDMPRNVVNVDNLAKEPVRKILFWD